MEGAGVTGTEGVIPQEAGGPATLPRHPGPPGGEAGGGEGGPSAPIPHPGEGGGTAGGTAGGGVGEGADTGGGSLALVERALREEPYSFSFFQAVRLLEKLNPERAPVGRFVDPDTEVVRFSVPPSLAFPPSEIHALELDDAGEAPAAMAVNFMGLTGPQGVLPYHYTLLVAERSRARDNTLRDFLDLFHHRMISLFYRAWEKHRFTVAYERGESDRLTEHLLDLVGVGLETLRGQLSVPDEALAFYAGLLSLMPRGAVALEQLIEDYFDVPASVEQFVGGWYSLPLRDQCALGDEANASARLGLGAVAGDEIWDQQARVRIRLGPMPRARYEEFLPTGSAYERLKALVRFFAHDQFDFEVQLTLSADEVPGCVLGEDSGEPQRLGWSTWIRTRPFERDADETVLVL